jgi:DNA-binding NarL/FixJ family response regulator
MGIQLTEDEERTIELVAAGWDNQSIADQLCLEYASLANRLQRIYKKLGFAGKRCNKRVMLTNWYERYMGTEHA